LAQLRERDRTIDERVAKGLDAGPHAPELITTEPEPSPHAAESICPASESTTRTRELNARSESATMTSRGVSCTVPEIIPMSGESTIVTEDFTMNKDQRAALRRFRRVQDFLTQHPQLASVTDLGKQTQVLDDVLVRLGVMGQEQDANRRIERAETVRQRALRATLRNNHMFRICKVARLLRGTTGMDRALVMPIPRADNDALLDAARGMAQAATKQAATFVAQGLPEDFIEQLRTATSALAGALGDRVESHRRGIVARQSIDQQVQRGTKSVQMLDALVTPLLEGDADLLAAWKTVKRPIEPGGVQSNAGSVHVGATPEVSSVAGTVAPAQVTKAA
jgi:hypothetical protein